MKKNVSGQKVGIQLVSATDGSAVTSGTTTVYVTLDAGTQATGSVGSGAATHEGHGYWTYAPSQAETNGDLVAFTFENTSAVNATVQIYTSFPQTSDAPTAAANADAVWDEVRSGHTTTGTFGGDASTPADVADAVLDEAMSGHTTAGTLGKAVGDILDDTGTSGVVVASGSKAGYSLTQSFPTNFASLAITAGGAITAGTVSDKTGYALSATGSAALTEGYATDGSAPTLNQILYMIWSMLAEKSVSTTTLTTKKLDGTTTAMTFTLDDGTSPTSITRAS